MKMSVITVLTTALLRVRLTMIRNIDSGSFIHGENTSVRSNGQGGVCGLGGNGSGRCFSATLKRGGSRVSWSTLSWAMVVPLVCLLQVK